MKEFATAIMGFPVESAPATGLNASPQPEERSAGQSYLPAPSPAVSAPSAATAGQPASGETEFLSKPVSVVAKVAKLLILHHQVPRLKRPIPWEDGYLHQKVLTSLQTNQQP